MHAPCQLCQNRPATVHLTELDPAGAVTALHCCPHCVARLHLRLDTDPPPIAEIVASSERDDDEPDDAAAPAPRGKPEPQCPSCGTTFAQYAANNILGCANDYGAFGSRLETLIRRHHGATQHAGRVPARHGLEGAARVAERARLERELREAVAAERFEEAARLRDRLRQAPA